MNKEKILNNVFWYALGSIIALFICFNEVYADENDIPPLAFRIFQNSNWQNVTTTSNAWVSPGQVVLEVGSVNSLIGKSTLPNYIWVRMCQQNENMRATDITTLDFAIGSAESARLIYTTSKCTPYGTDLTGVIVYAEWGISNGGGSECYVDLDINNWVCNINTAMAFNVDQYAGYGEVYYGYSNQPLNIADAEKYVEQGIGTLVEQNQIIIDTQKETNQKLESIENAILSDEEPDLSSLGDTAGWLPPGPLDTVLNLPLTILNSLTNIFASECTPATLPLPYVNKTIELPCVNTLYDKIDGLDTFINWITIPLGAYILFKYFMHLYEWVDNTLTFRENNYIDNWGGV